MLCFAFFVFGAVVGSFLNVCVHRLPRGDSVVFPASHCPHCRQAIRPFDNVPVLSYLILHGRCRQCGSGISLRYPLVEVLTGVAAAGAFSALGLSAHTLLVFAFLCALIVITFIDLDHQIIPDAISLPGIGIGFAAALILGQPSWQASLGGILLGGGLLWAVAEGYYRLTGREGMGGGDIKLLAMIGAFLGWRGVPVALLVGSLSGAIIGGALMIVQRRDRRTPIPFGPFLALGAVCAVFWGDALLTWYLKLASLT